MLLLGSTLSQNLLSYISHHTLFVLEFLGSGAEGFKGLETPLLALYYEAETHCGQFGGYFHSLSTSPT